MSFDRQIANRRINRIGPIGRIVGLLTACMVAVIGLLIGLEPEIILWRAFAAACVSGTVVAFGVSVIQAANDQRN